MPEINFADGFTFTPKTQKQPDYILGKISCKREEAIRWLQAQSEEWVNIDVKLSKKGKVYCAKNEWTRQSNVTSQPVGAGGGGGSTGEVVIEYPEEEVINPEDIPF